MGSGASVRVLGVVAIDCDGTTLAPSPQRALLLSLLVARLGTPVSTGVLAEALWGDRPPASSATALRVALTHLRRALGPLGAGLRHDPSGYRLDLPGERVDVVRFEAAALGASGAAASGCWDRAAAEAAAALREWAGRPFGGLGDDVHLLGEAARLAGLRRGAVVASVTALLALGRPAEAVAVAEPAVADEPLDEGLCLAKVVALAAAGRATEAVRWCQRQRAVLDEEVGLPPGPVLLEAEDRLLRGRPVEDLLGPWLGAAERARGPRREPAPPASWHRLHDAPFVGRRFELAQVSAALATPGWVVLTGPAGIGKTALVVRAAAEVTGLQVVFVACGGATAERLRSLRDALEQHRPLIEDLLEPGDPLRVWLDASPTSDDARDRRGATEGFESAVLERGLRALFERSAPRGPLVLVVDDLQDADPGLLEVLERFVASSRPMTVPVVLCCRSLTAVPARPRSVLADLARSWPSLLVVTLGGLSAEDVARLVGDRQLAGSLHDRSGGNPLFVRALARGGPSAGLPSDARLVLRALLDPLPPPVLRTLEVAAVVGERFELSVVAAALGQEEDDVLSHLEAASAQGCVEADPRSMDHFAFEHGLLREELLTGMPRRRRCQHEAAIAGALTSRGPGRQIERALRMLAAAPLVEAVDVAAGVVAGVEAAVAVGAFQDADVLLGGAAQLVRSDPAAGAWLTLARAIRAAGVGERATARRLYASAARLGTEWNVPAVVAESLAGHLGPWVLRWETDEAAVDLLERARAEPVVRADSAAAARVDATLARALHFAADRAQAGDLARAALERSRSLADPRARLDALRTVLLVSTGPTLATERRRWAGEALELSTGRADHGAVLVDATSTALALGAGEEARAHGDELAGLAASTGDRLLSWLADVILGAISTAEGDDARAAARMASARSHGDAIGVPEAPGTFLTQRFVLRWHQGELGRAITPLQKVVDSAPAPAWRAALALALASEAEAGAGAELELVLAAIDGASIDYLWAAAVVFAAAAAAALGRVEACDVLARSLDRCTAPCAVLGAATAVLGPFDLWRSVIGELSGHADAAGRQRRAAIRAADDAGWARWSDLSWLVC